jgi:AraC-like DNA-binding protein
MGSMDSILDILRATRLNGGIILEAEFTAPWCVTSQMGPEDCAPFTPLPVNIIAYHYISAGSLLVEVEGNAPVTVKGGELVVIPRNDPHRMGSALNPHAVNTHDLIQPGAKGGLARILHGGGGERTHMLCGFLGTETANDPLLQILPPVMKIDFAASAAANWIESSMTFAARELAAGHIGSPPTLARLAELLFMEAVRRYLSSLPDEQRGWRAGVRDPIVARALGLLHGRMNQRWTGEELAREVGLSRSALADRFTRVMGEPPIRYLAQLRLQSAAHRLKGSSDSIARIAFQVGYESEAAFNRAFKREFGVPPATWRRRT